MSVLEILKTACAAVWLAAGILLGCAVLFALVASLVKGWRKRQKRRGADETWSADDARSDFDGYGV